MCVGRRDISCSSPCCERNWDWNPGPVVVVVVVVVGGGTLSAAYDNAS